MKGQKVVIIKKVKKRGHEGSHGGSWKVAYADFVTAMMAFFLLLWLLSMVSPEKRARVATYFKSFSLFEKSGSSMVMEYPGSVTGDSGGEFGKLEQDFAKGATDVLKPEALKEKLRHEIQSKLSDIQDQVMVDSYKGSVRIQLVDKEGRPMFALGSPELSPDARKILSVIAESIKGLENKIAIEGHTDALSYSSGRYTNWELSTDRASAARKELEQNGINPDKLSMVAGYAATEPLIRDNPNDPRNRRISIMLLYPQRAPGAAKTAGEEPEVAVVN